MTSPMLHEQDQKAESFLRCKPTSRSFFLFWERRNETCHRDGWAGRRDSAKHCVPAAYDGTSQAGSRYLCWPFQLPEKRLLLPNVCHSKPHWGGRRGEAYPSSISSTPTAASCLPLATESTWKAKMETDYRTQDLCSRRGKEISPLH